MITQLRKQLNGKFFRGFILLVCLLMTGVLSIPFLLKQDTVPWAFSVNGIKITQKQLDQATYEQQERLMQFRAQYGQLSDYFLKSMNMSTDPRELAKQQLEQEALIDYLSSEINIYPRIKGAISLLGDSRYHWFTRNFIPEFVFNEDGSLNQFAVKAYLQKNQMTVEAFYLYYAKIINRYLVSSLVEMTGYLPKTFMDNMVNAYAGSKSFNYIEFYLADYIKKAQKEEPSDQTLETFFQEQKEHYRVPEKRTITQWVFDPINYGVKVTNEQLVEYYEKHKNSKYVKSQSQTTIRLIRYKGNPINKPSIADLKDELTKSPELFTQKARLYSDDTESAQNGGLLKPFTRGALDPAIEKAAFSIENEGGISDVIPLKDGFALIQLIGRTQRTFLDLADVKNEIEELVKRNSFIEQVKQDFSEMPTTNRNAIENFAQNHHGVKSSETKMFDSQDQVSSKTFMLEIGDSDSFVSKDKAYLFILESIKESAMPPLAQVREYLVDDWQKNQALLALNTDINDLRNLLKKSPLSDAAPKLGYQLKKTELLKRTDENKLKKMEKDSFPVSQMIELAVPGTVAIGFDGNKAVFVQLDQIVSPQIKDEKELKATTAALREQNSRQVMRALIANLNKNARIEYNQMTQTSLEDLF